MDKILETITSIVQTYEGGEFKDLHVMHRILTCNIFYLSNEQVKARSEWLSAYYNSKETSNAAKERDADKTVPQLYMCRKILETAKGVSISIGYELKLN